jgi:hypothetical protein
MRSSQARASMLFGFTRTPGNPHTAKPPSGASPSSTRAVPPRSRPSASAGTRSRPRPAGSSSPRRKKSRGAPARATPAGTPPRKDTVALVPSASSTTKAGWSRWATSTSGGRPPPPARRTTFPAASRPDSRPGTAAARSST